MAKSDDLLLNQKEYPRLGFLRNSNRKIKVTDGDALLSVSLGTARSTETHRNPPPRLFGIPFPCFTQDCVDESSQASNSDLGASSTDGDLNLMDFTRHIPALNHQQNRKTQMNDASAPKVKKSGSKSNTTPVSRLSKQKEETARPPKYPISLVGKRATNRTPESKQLKPLKDPDGSAKTSTISRIREPVNSVKEAKPPKNPTALVENGGTSSTIVASKNGFQKSKTAQASKDPVEEIKNIGTKRIAASNIVKDKKETAQPHKHPPGLVKNTVTSKIPSSGNSLQKNKTTQSSKDSALLVRKSEASSRTNSVQKQSEKRESSQSSKGTSGLVRKTGIVRVLPSYLFLQEEKSIAANPIRQDQSTYHHIVWEGFDEDIVPFEKSCPLCECDLAEDQEYDPEVERFNHAENAVLSCGHAFHSLCLQMATSEDNSRDPPCFICLSLS